MSLLAVSAVDRKFLWFKLTEGWQAFLGAALVHSAGVRGFLVEIQVAEKTEIGSRPGRRGIGLHLEPC